MHAAVARYVPDDVAAAPAVVVARLSERLGIPVGELRGYGAREQTRTGHLREVTAYLGWRQVDEPRWKDLEEFLFARAMEHDLPKLLFRQACEYLSSSCLVRPGVVKILERVATVRDRAREETSVLLGPVLTEPRCAELDRLLLVDPVLGRTRLSWLGTGPVAATPGSVKGELEKLAYLRWMIRRALYVGSEVRRGPDYVRMVIVAVVDAADAVEALDLTSRTGPYLLETATAPVPRARGCWEGLDHDPPPKIFVRRPSAGITLLVGLSPPMEAPASAPAATIGPESGASIGGGPTSEPDRTLRRIRVGQRGVRTPGGRGR